MAAVGNAVKQMDAQQIAEFESKGSVTLAGETLSAGEIKVRAMHASLSSGAAFHTVPAPFWSATDGAAHEEAVSMCSLRDDASACATMLL